MDETDNRVLWDRKYEEGLPSLTKPDPFFVSAYGGLVDRSFPKAGMALDLAARARKTCAVVGGQRVAGERSGCFRSRYWETQSSCR